MKALILYIKGHSLWAGNMGLQKLYHIIQKNFYWTSLAVGCCVTAVKCPHCARNHINYARTLQNSNFPGNVTTHVCVYLYSL